MGAVLALPSSGYAASGIPSLVDILALPLAHAGRYELYEGEIQTLRARIYAINMNNAGKRKYRTSKLPLSRSAPPRKGYADTRKYLLLVWRVK